MLGISETLSPESCSIMRDSDVHSWSQADQCASGQSFSLSYMTKRMKQLFKGLMIWHKRFWVRSKGDSIGVCK